ncbi:MAG TPA: helix-turn-helix transcriptional regulator [Opitutus sp.]|nr:helix-turn-helix transcriptional regulator [Opitutus sp.]
MALDRNPRDRRFAIFSVLLQDALRDAISTGRRDQLALLTLAERRVAKLATEGLRNREIAAHLGKSVMTVKSQLGTIFSKLAVRSRTQLAAVLRSSAANG